MVTACVSAEPAAGAKRSSYVSQAWRGVLGVGVVMVAVMGCGTTRAAEPRRAVSASVRSAPGRGTITIDPQIGETFGPAPAAVAPKLTAQQAWARFTRHNTAIPSAVHAHLGFLTLPVGPADAPGASQLVNANGEAYAVLNKLVYGYSSMSGCVTLNPRLLPPPGAHCIYWGFLDANTGKEIDSTYQKIGHWHWLINPNGP
jgi:hypothetical protein